MVRRCPGIQLFPMTSFRVSNALPLKLESTCLLAGSHSDVDLTDVGDVTSSRDTYDKGNEAAQKASGSG